MDCKYSHKLEADYYGRNFLYCELENRNCPLVRHCGRVDNIINVDDYEKKCKLYMEKEMANKKTSSLPNKVRFEMKNGNLAVETNNEDIPVIQVKNPFDYVPKEVKLIKRNGDYYIKNEKT